MTTEVRTITFAEASGMAPFDAAEFEAKYPEIAKERREQEAASAASAAKYREEQAEREAAKEAEREACFQAAAALIYNIDTTPGTTDTICQNKIWHGGDGVLTCLQYRREHSESTIEDMVDLIERGIPFETPIRLARYTDELGPKLALVDGHHRVAAFSRLGVWDIPAHHFSIVDVDSMAEASLLAAGANVKHGKGNTHADYYGIIKNLMDHAYKGKYRKNAFEPDIAKIAEAIGAPKAAVSRGYNNYFGTEKDKHPSLSVQCKEMRDVAIIHHYKEGKNNSEIAKLFQISCPKTVAEVIAKAIEDGEIKPRPVAPAVLPMCSTEDRSDTRLNAKEYIDGQLQELLDEYAEYIPFAEDECEDDTPPFDVLAVTGFGTDIAKYTKRVKPKRQLLEERKATLLKELEEIEKELSELEEGDK